MNFTDSNRSVEILDTTLRDGSYAVDFQFTVGQTKSICRALESAGVRLIEIGHGVGMNAGSAGYREAIATDEEYMTAASAACDDALWGMFCIPGVATLEDIERAAEHDMGFIRIGTNINEVEESKPFIELAKSHDMFVAANYMKSYARPPAELAEKVELSRSYGADMVYLVDSAGGMMPETVKQYYSAAREACDIPIGFHGHDNLGLSVANSLMMAEEGARVLDTSLMGLGRSAGNAPTETVVATLEKQGYDTGIDLFKLLRIAHKHIEPLQSNPIRLPLDIVAGFYEFHSSHLSKILDAAYSHDVDPALLIGKVCEQNKIYAPKDLIEEIAAEHSGEGEGRVEDYGFARYTGSEENERRK